MPAATHAAISEDELAGGYVTIMDGATDYYTTTRQIVGNDASAADVAFKIYLDAGITYAITAGTSAIETYRNPYGSIVESRLRDQVKAGLPMAYVSAAENYFWAQKSGICWPIPQGSLGNAGGYGSGWIHDYGNISDINTALGVTVAAANSSQYAGKVIAGSIGGNGPLFDLNL